MFAAMLRLQWRWLRTPLLLLSTVALAIPVLGIAPPWGNATSQGVEGLLSSGQLAGGLLAILAALSGIVVGDVLWRQDARHAYSYPMSLPIRRDTYLRHRASGGALLLLIPAAAMWLGLATIGWRAELPPGVHAYAADTAARAFVVMLLALSVTFAARHGMGLRGRRVLLGLGILVVAITWLEGSRPASERRVSRAIGTAFSGTYSPFAVLFTSWRVVDL